MIDLDDKQARRALAKQARELSPTKIQAAQRRAVNRGITGARTEMSREVRKTVRVKSADVRDAVAIEKASGSVATPEAKMRVRHKPIPLAHFGSPRQTKKGVSVTVIKGKRQAIPSAFIVDNLGGHVFKRKGAARLPIRKLFGPSVRQLAPHALETIEPKVVARLEKELVRQLERMIEKATT